jgi:FdhD protein
LFRLKVPVCGFRQWNKGRRIELADAEAMRYIAKHSVISQPVAVSRLGQAGEQLTVQIVAEEIPCAFRYNGFSHAVMMVTPDDLEDFVFGFSLTEGIIQEASDIRSFRVSDENGAIIANVELVPASLHRFLASRRVRQLQGRTSCGLCGVEDLKDIRRPDRRLSKEQPLTPDAIASAIRHVRDFQPLSRGTRAAHAAAWVDRSGNIAAIREDIGRHNALDKLIGARLRQSTLRGEGFCLITSRCSYEMAQKAIAAGIGTLVSISAPTAYAVRTAQSAGMALYSLSGDGEHLLYTNRSSSEALHDVKET